MKMHLDTTSSGQVKLFLRNEEGHYTSSLTREQFVEQVLALSLALEVPEVQDWLVGILDERQFQVEMRITELKTVLERLNQAIRSNYTMSTSLWTQKREAKAELAELEGRSGF